MELHNGRVRHLGKGEEEVTVKAQSMRDLKIDKEEALHKCKLYLIGLSWGSLKHPAISYF